MSSLKTVNHHREGIDTSFRDGPLEKWWGGGLGNFQLPRIFFFRSQLVQEFFFQVNPSARIFFSDENCFFFEQWNLDSLSIFLCFINYSTLTTDQWIQATLMQNLFENVHSERGGNHLEWTASLCISSVQALWNSSPTAHRNDAILHSPMKNILCGS